MLVTDNKRERDFFYSFPINQNKLGVSLKPPFRDRTS
jgi:hypothetical protein